MHSYEPIYAPSVLVQIVLVIIGALYTYFAWRQWQAIKEQAQLTKDSLIADKRAFVFADSFTQTFEPDPSTGLYNWRLRPRWRNTGSTSTSKLRVYVQCEIRNSPLPANYTFPQEQNDAKGMIGPHHEMLGGPAPQRTGITPEDILAAQQFKKFIYLWGWAKYFDAFPDTPEHTTHFCWLILVTGDPKQFVPNTQGQPPVPGTLAFNYLQHTEGNYAD
jgi:hypothetical protein